MFENKKVYVPKINEEVHVSRIIASWVWHAIQVFGAVDTTDGPEYAFNVWLEELGISEEDKDYILNFFRNGKLELEILVRKFEMTHEVLDY